MAPLPSFLLTGGINEVLGDIVAEELHQTVSTRAVITLQSNWPSDVPLVWESEINWLKQPVIARINNSGELVNEDGDELRLLARHPDLVENLQWRISVDLPPTVLPPKPGGRLRTWTIDAGEDNTTVDLSEAVPMATVKGMAALRGPRGYSPWYVPIEGTDPQLYQAMTPEGPIGPPTILTLYDLSSIDGGSP